MGAILAGIFGDEAESDEGRRALARDFIGRYERGEPWPDLSGREAADCYGRVAGRVPREHLRSAAEEVYDRLPRGRRAELGHRLGQRLGFLGGNPLDDPRELAGLTARFQQQIPGGFADLFAAGDDGRAGEDGAATRLEDPLARAVLGGIAAVAVGRMLGPR